MSTRRARVVVAYATVKVLDSATGKPTVVGFYRDAIFPQNADPDGVATLVRREYAEWLDDEAPAIAAEAKSTVELAPADDAEQPPAEPAKKMTKAKAEA